MVLSAYPYLRCLCIIQILFFGCILDGFLIRTGYSNKFCSSKLFARMKRTKRTQITSPFENLEDPLEYNGPKLPLNTENIETVLNEIRPYLQTHGGNIKLSGFDASNGSIDVQLTGSCVSCTSSEVTLKLGIERRLVSRLEGIHTVQQVLPIPPPVTIEAIDSFLATEIRPSLDVAEATVNVVSIEAPGTHDLRPCVILILENLHFAVDSIKEEIVEKLVGYYMGTIKVLWDRGGQ